MKSLEQFGLKALKLVGSRIALNIYFWVLLFSIKLPDIDDQVAYSQSFYIAMIVFYMLFFVWLSYINNLVLLPKLLFAKKRLLYFLSAITLAFVTAFVYTYFLKSFPQMYPGFDSMEVSIVMDPLDKDLSIQGILNGIQTYFIIMLVWLTIFSLLGYYHYAIRKTRILEEQINKHREAELAFIKNQMNPHFLFNTLNNLYGLAIKKSDETPEIILKLSAILRYLLYESDAEKVSFDKEKEIIQAYIDIELLRIPQTPDIQFSIISDKPYQIPPLLWLAPLENIFKHSRSMANPEIDFRFSIVQNQFHLFAKNNFKKPAETQSGGLGLSNLQKRLDWLYPERYKLNTSEKENYFIIELTIDLTNV